MLLEFLIQNIWSWSLISPWNVFLLFQLLLKTPLSAQICSQETSKTPYVLPSLFPPTWTFISASCQILNCLSSQHLSTAPVISIHTGALFAVICIDITDSRTTNIYMCLLYTVLLNKDKKKTKQNSSNQIISETQDFQSLSKIYPNYLGRHSMLFWFLSF